MKTDRKIIVTLLLVACYAGCSGSEQKTQPASTAATAPVSFEDVGNELSSNDGICSVTTYGGWQKTSGLHQKAQLQIANPFREMYLVVFSEKKENFTGVTLEEHARVTSNNLLKSLAAPTVSGRSTVTISGNSALQEEITGMAKNLKIRYIHTNVETPEYFHQILAWTLDSKFEQNEPALKNLISSFKETEGGSATPAK